MKHRLYLPTFLPVSFPDAMETFLEDMAKKGWFLKKVGYFLSFCQFEKGTPPPSAIVWNLFPIRCGHLLRKWYNFTRNLAGNI